MGEFGEFWGWFGGILVIFGPFGADFEQIWEQFGVIWWNLGNFGMVCGGFESISEVFGVIW